jgi:hypothetical protein
MNGGEKSLINFRKYVQDMTSNPLTVYNPKLLVLISPSTNERVGNGYTEKVYINKLRLVQH